MTHHRDSSFRSNGSPEPRNAIAPGRVKSALALAVAASAAVAGCLETTVSVSNTGGNGGEASSTSSVASGNQSVVTSAVTGGGNMTTAVTLTADQLPSGWNPCFSQMCTIPPGMIFIELASLGNTCADPIGPTMSSVSYWRRGVALPAEYQAVGTYSLTDPAIFYEGGEGIVQTGTAAASSGGGPGLGQGTIEVVSIDATSVTVKFTGTSLNLSEDGQYVAPRCAP